MRTIVTCGPTREYIDRVRFITNASSGAMGCAVAARAAAAGHQVTLLAGPISREQLDGARAAGCDVVPFVSVADLRRELESRFAACDAVVMAAAVGDFTVEHPFAGKLRRSGGPVTITLVPTSDIIAAVASNKRPGQMVVCFAVEEGTDAEIEAKAAQERIAKHGDYVVVNTPAAMGAAESKACIMGPSGLVLPWATRPKDDLAAEIVKLL